MITSRAVSSIFYWLICFVSVIVSRRDITHDITVTCLSCEDVSQFRGIVGKNLTVRYTINNALFHDFTITYAKTSTIDISPALRVNTDQVDDGRFIIPERLSKEGSLRTIIITLTQLSLNDVGNEFTYIYRKVIDQDVKTFIVPSKIVSVTVTPKELPHDDNSGFHIGTIILIVVVVIIVVLGTTILIVLFKKGIISTNLCFQSLCCLKKKEIGEDIPLEQDGSDEPMRVVQKDQEEECNMQGQKQTYI